MRNTRVISGYIVPSFSTAGSIGEDEESSDEDDNDDFQELDFSDKNVFSSDSIRIKATPLKRKSVRFFDFANGRSYDIYGQFPLVGLWWNVQCRINDQKTVVGYPWYRLRTDDGVFSSGAMLLFLKVIKVDDEALSPFASYIRSNSLENRVTFQELKNLVKEFEEDAKKRDLVYKISERLTSGIGGAILNSLSLPLFFQYIPQILPKYVSKLMCFDEEVLAELEKELQSRPWIFAFTRVLTADYRINNMEACIADYCISGLLQHITDYHIINAMHIYYALKNESRRNGHTYVTFSMLRQAKFYQDYIVSDWNGAINFLEENEIVVCEPELSEGHLRYDTKIFIYRYWYAEKNIAKIFKRLIYNQSEDESAWKFDIDMDSPYFDRIKNDEDQKKAAILISQSPIVVLSGKGGCGKTEVVSQVFAYARLKFYQQWCARRAAEGSSAQELRKIFDERFDSDLKSISTSHNSIPVTSFNTSAASNETICVTNSHNASAAEANSTSEFSQDSLSAEEVQLWIECGKNADREYNLSQKSSKLNEIGNANIIDCVKGDGQNISAQDIKLTEIENTRPSSFMDNGSGMPVQDKADDERIAARLTSDRILITAPTGRAANLLSRRSKIQAYTLHQIQYSYSEWTRTPRSLHDKWKHSNVNVLVVDECSLVPVTLFNNVLKALMYNAQLRKVVLLGDIHQLPSIDPGYFLADVYQSLERIGCGLMLKTNHRAESQCIIDNADRILNRLCPIPNPAMNFHQVTLQTFNSDACHDAIQKLLQEKLLPDHTRNQFIAFRREDCDMINELCCKYYCNHSCKELHGKKKRLKFCVGDKVCCTRNAEVRLIGDPMDDEDVDVLTREKLDDEELEEILNSVLVDQVNEDGNDKSDTKKAKKEVLIKPITRRLCNGQLFIIKHLHDVYKQDGKLDDTHVTLLECGVENALERKFSQRELIKSCGLRHGWARTIHTFQGSEAECVVYVVGKPYNQTLQHVYTAVTRGRSCVVMVAQQMALERAVRTKPSPRYTSLKQRLQDVCDEYLQTMNQDDNMKTSGQVKNTPSKPICGIPSHLPVNHSICMASFDNVASASASVTMDRYNGYKNPSGSMDRDNPYKKPISSSSAGDTRASTSGGVNHMDRYNVYENLNSKMDRYIGYEKPGSSALANDRHANSSPIDLTIDDSDESESVLSDNPYKKPISNSSAGDNRASTSGGVNHMDRYNAYENPNSNMDRYIGYEKPSSSASANYRHANSSPIDLTMDDSDESESVLSDMSMETIDAIHSIMDNFTNNRATVEFKTLNTSNTVLHTEENSVAAYNRSPMKRLGVGLSNTSPAAKRGLLESSSQLDAYTSLKVKESSNGCAESFLGNVAFDSEYITDSELVCEATINIPDSTSPSKTNGLVSESRATGKYAFKSLSGYSGSVLACTPTNMRVRNVISTLREAENTEAALAADVSPLRRKLGLGLSIGSTASQNGSSLDK